MQKSPVNSLSLELIQSVSNTLTELEKNKCEGLVLVSVNINCKCKSRITLFDINYLIFFRLLESFFNIFCW